MNYGIYGVVGCRWRVSQWRLDAVVMYQMTIHRYTFHCRVMSPPFVWKCSCSLSSWWNDNNLTHKLPVGRWVRCVISPFIPRVHISAYNKEYSNPALKWGLQKTVGGRVAAVWDRTLPCSCEIRGKSLSCSCLLQAPYCSPSIPNHYTSWRDSQGLSFFSLSHPSVSYRTSPLSPTTYGLEGWDWDRLNRPVILATVGHLQVSLQESIRKKVDANPRSNEVRALNFLNIPFFLAAYGL